MPYQIVIAAARLLATEDNQALLSVARQVGTEAVAEMIMEIQSSEVAEAFAAACLEADEMGMWREVVRSCGPAHGRKLAEALIHAMDQEQRFLDRGIGCLFQLLVVMDDEQLRLSDAKLGALLFLGIREGGCGVEYWASVAMLIEAMAMHKRRDLCSTAYLYALYRGEGPSWEPWLRSCENSGVDASEFRQVETEGVVVPEPGQFPITGFYEC